MRITLDWWNFEESAAGFFLYSLTIAGLYMCLSYFSTESAGRYQLPR